MRLVITGATGYIGERLALTAMKHGHEVIAATRRRPVAASMSWLPFDLASTSAIVFPPNVHAVIHLAADTSLDTGENDRQETDAARLLIAAARQARVRFVFVSSQTARPDAPTAYGRTKWRIEQDVLAAGGWVVRPGQVYGGPERALFGVLAAIVRQQLLLPAFFPAPHIQPIHVDDLAIGLLDIVERDSLVPGVLCLASPQPVSFTRFLRTVAVVRLRRRRWFVPVPVAAVNLVRAVIGPRLSRQTGLERLSSLFDLPRMDSAADIAMLGLTLRPLQCGMHRSGNARRRGLLDEGRALLAYVLKDGPGMDLLRRYVRMVETVRNGLPLELPALLRRWPVMLALLDDRSFARAANGEEFAWRLDAASLLAEASVQGASRFLGIGRGHASGAVAGAFHIGCAVLSELAWRVLRVVSLPFGLARHIGDRQ